MAREYVLKCNICGKVIENVAGKIYIAPIIPGRAISYMSAYSHSGDLCTECLKDFAGKLAKRQPRNGNGKSKKPPRKKRATR